MEKYKCNVIVCGPAIGKTYLSKIDNRFIDIDGLKADYKYGLKDIPLKEKERGKLNRGKIINNDSSKYAIELLKQTIKDNKIALISYNTKIIEYIINNNIPYCLVYADKSLREEYAKRMKERGNNDFFINQMTDKIAWNDFYLKNEQDKIARYKIKLNNQEYLSDIKDLFV